MVMTLIDVVVYYFIGFLGLPVLSYLVVKFGTVGYLSARNRFEKKHEIKK